MGALARLVGESPPACAKRVRRGAVPGAVRSFDSTGYVIGWRSATAYLESVLKGEALALAKERLLALRAGRLTALKGEFSQKKLTRESAADYLTDDELLDTIRRAHASGGAGSRGQFDRWLASAGAGWHHRDLEVRLCVASWDAALALAGVSSAVDEASESADLRDPITALCKAAAELGGGTGRELSAPKFNDWAERNGSPVRSHDVRTIYGSWNKAKVAAGLEINDHAVHGDGK